MEWGNLSAYVTWQTVTVVGAAALFAGFLIWKFRPTFPLPRLSRLVRRRRAAPRDVAGVKAQIGLLREDARRAKTRRERATALAQAASLASSVPEGMTSALGLYLRAMRADPTFGEPIRGVSSLLRKERPELLESLLWRRLSHMSWDGDTREAARCAVQGLGGLYRRELRHRDRARVMQKLAARLE
jgi:hypothetical protein